MYGNGNRHGIIKWTRESYTSDFEMLSKLLYAIRVIPFKVELNYATDTFEMWCYSPYFDVCVEGVRVHEYMVDYQLDDLGEFICKPTVKKLV